MSWMHVKLNWFQSAAPWVIKLSVASHMLLVGILIVPTACSSSLILGRVPQNAASWLHR